MRFSIPVKPSDSLPSFLAVVCFQHRLWLFHPRTLLHHWNGELALFGRGLLYLCVFSHYEHYVNRLSLNLKQHTRKPLLARIHHGSGPSPLTSRHVKLLATTVVLTFIVSTLVDFQFKLVVGDAISEKDERTAFFGTFGICGILGGLIQFGLTSRVVERFGILFALALLPTLMLSGSIALHNGNHRSLNLACYLREQRG